MNVGPLEMRDRLFRDLCHELSMMADLTVNRSSHGSRTREYVSANTLPMVWSTLRELPRLQGHRHLDMPRESG